MVEHTLSQVGNGDGDKKKLSSHIVETVWGLIGGSLAECIESAYTALSDRAAREDSLIVGVVQSMAVYTWNKSAYVLVTLTAQRIGREDFERQQRMAQFSGGPRR